MAGGGAYLRHRTGRPPLRLDRNSMFFWRGVAVGIVLVGMGVYYLGTGGSSDERSTTVIAVENDCSDRVAVRIVVTSSSSGADDDGSTFVTIEPGSVGKLVLAGRLTTAQVEIRSEPSAATVAVLLPATQVVRIEDGSCPT